MSKRSNKKKQPVIIDDEVKAEASVTVKAPEPTKEEPMMTLDEAAIDLGVSKRCALLWFNNGHLQGVEKMGFVRVSRQSIANCRTRFLGGVS